MGDPIQSHGPHICRSSAVSVGGLEKIRAAAPCLLLGFALSKDSTTSGAERGAEQQSMTTRLRVDAHRHRKRPRRRQRYRNRRVSTT